MPANPRAFSPEIRTAGDECKLSRLDTYRWSWESAPLWRKIHRSSAMRSERAFSTEHMMSAAAMSTSLLEFMYFGYGKPIIRLSGPGVRISSGVRLRCNQALGLPAATDEKRDHSSDTRTWCSSTPSPAAARRAVSNIG